MLAVEYVNAYEDVDVVRMYISLCVCVMVFGCCLIARALLTHSHGRARAHRELVS